MRIPNVISTKTLPNYKLLLSFDNGEQKYLDVTPYLSFPVYAALKDQNFFATAFVCNGTVCWGEDASIDIAPHRAWMESSDN